MQPELVKPRIGPPEALLVIVTAFWLGMIATLFLAIPTIFGSLPDDRALAGRIAASVFSKADDVRVGLALVALLAGIGSWRRRRGARGSFAFAVLPILAAISVAAGVWYVAPSIARAQAEGTTQSESFKMLHRAGTTLFVVESVLALMLLLVTTALAPARRPTSSATA